MYKHTQGGRIMVLSAVGLAAGALVGYITTPAHVMFYPMALAAAVVYFGFRDLTVEVDHEAVRLTFGVGLVKKSFPLAGINSVEQVRNSWLHGWGIHYIGDGWLYNVAGYDAVELRFTDGGRARIGTDEPDALAAAIRERIATRR